MSESQGYIFWPQNIGPYSGELQVLLQLLSCSSTVTESSSKIAEHLQQLPAFVNADIPYLRYRAYLLVLLDLLRQGWDYTCRAGRLYLAPPRLEETARSSEEAQAQKQAIRVSLSYERLAQLRKPSVQQFIQQMERPRAFGNTVVSIRSLFADGWQLANDLAALVALSEAEQNQAVHDVIKPYLQLITPNARCTHTGLLLSDIWRYMRHTWSIPYHSTPGRNMFYLVRDAARDFHPIIGIAALGSSMVQITDRDDTIGWTPKAMLQRIHDKQFTDADAQAIVRMLYTTLRDAIADIAIDGLVEAHEVEQPTSAVLSRLQHIEETARARRVALLQEERQLNGRATLPLFRAVSEDSATEQINSFQEVKEQAVEALFQSKRARALRDLLAAKLALPQRECYMATVERLRRSIATAEGKQAIGTLVRENKKRRVGINMMDIIVCGSIPPYNFLLGGKLIAMLMASPNVVWDYKQKYATYRSHIASEMKRADVRREPKLVFLGTTSLYHVGSSQYNRIAIPVGTSREKIKYQRMGKTIGHGSVHFSTETIRALNELQIHTRSAVLINNRFGEGVNPKLRRVSAGLAQIGLENVEHFTNHRSRRIVYGVPLGRSVYQFLRGETLDPQYFFDCDSQADVEGATQAIIQHWSDRWLLMRARQTSVLSKVADWKVDDYLLSEHPSL